MLSNALKNCDVVIPHFIDYHAFNRVILMGSNDVGLAESVMKYYYGPISEVFSIVIALLIKLFQDQRLAWLAEMIVQLISISIEMLLQPKVHF